MRTSTEDAEMVALAMCLKRFNDCSCGFKAEITFHDCPLCLTCGRKKFLATETSQRGIIGLSINDFDRSLKLCDDGDVSILAYPNARTPLLSEPQRKLAARFNALLRGEP